MFVKSFRYNYNIINIGSSKVMVRTEYFINFLLDVGYRALIAYNRNAEGLLSLICNNY